MTPMTRGSPVLILQNLTPDGPGYLGTWLDEQRVPYEVFNTEAGQEYPRTIEGYRALALMGGEMSANDELPSLRRAEQLILDAMDNDIAVIGHCLGGQLMARALGARVVKSRAPEIGWQTMQVADSVAARDWFGAPGPRTVYHWHYESFELPAGAQLLASSAACGNQAFSIGRHLAMQFHVELDLHKLAKWSVSVDPQFLALQKQYASVQSGAAMRDQAKSALAQQQAFAHTLYSRWLGIA
jgi:GMP synthase (glutamine-hydrolysing)